MTRLLPSLLFVTIGLAGCSTAGDLKQRGPTITMESTKPSRTVAGCFSEKLTAKHTHFVHTISTRVITNGYAVQHESMMGYWGKTTNMFSEITDKPSGGSTTVVFFPFDAFDSFIQLNKGMLSECM